MALPKRLSTHALEAFRLGDGRRAEVGELLGRGRIGETYRVVVEGAFGLRRELAGRHMRPLASDEGDATESLLAVARAWACVDHPNVVRLHDVAMVERRPLLLLDLVRGVSLHAILERFADKGQRFPLDAAIAVALQVAEGLRAARLARDADGQVVALAHLDVHPREVLLSWRGEVKVTDFQLARFGHVISGVRDRSVLFRLAEGMAPEVARGGAPDARSDVFSLGLLMHQMLFGSRFQRSWGEQHVLELAREGWIPDGGIQRQLDDELGEVVRRALAVDPQDRFANVDAVAYRLRRIAARLVGGDARALLEALMEREMREDPDVAAARAVARGSSSRVLAESGGEGGADAESTAPHDALDDGDCDIIESVFARDGGPSLLHRSYDDIEVHGAHDHEPAGDDLSEDETTHVMRHLSSVPRR